MADLGQVRDTLKAIIVAAAYPNGTGAASAITVGGAPQDCAMVAGWPVKDQLELDLKAGLVTISVFPVTGAERNTTRFSPVWQVIVQAAPTLTVAVTDTTVTLGGSVSTPQNIAVVTGGKSYLYAVQPADTLASVASALAALISADTTATSVGPVITIPGAQDLASHVGAAGKMIRELRRQERLFQITCWCPTPEIRDAVGPFVDGVLSGAGLPNVREFIALPDGSQGRLLYVRSVEIDRDQLVNSFRRDLVYSVEYPTTEVRDAFQIVTTRVALTAGPDLPDATFPVATFNQ